MNKDSLKVGIHRPIHDKVDPEIDVYRKILDFNGIKNISLDSSKLDFWDQIKSVTHFIYKWSHSHRDHQIANAIIPVIERHLKIKCFPNWQTSWHYDDKIKQYYELKAFNYPVAESYVFYHKTHALDFVEKSNYPLVHKLKNGAGSLNVNLVKSKSEAIALVNKSFGKGWNQDSVSIFRLAKVLNYDLVKISRSYGIKLRNLFITPERENFWLKHKNYILFQEFLPNNHYDTRVTTAGNRVHAFRRFNRKNDFRASGANNWDINPDNIDKRMLRIALDISKNMGYQAMAYDFLYDVNGNPKIVEISCTYGGAGYPDFMNGYWDENLQRHEGRFWPQYFEMLDFLEYPELKCPDNLDYDTGYKLVSGTTR